MARATDPDPDPARARLATLGAGRAFLDGGGRPVTTGPFEPERVGWPTAPPGTPAARLRLSGAGAVEGLTPSTTAEWSPEAVGTGPDRSWTAAPRTRDVGRSWSEDAWGDDAWADGELDAHPDQDGTAADSWHHGPGDASDHWARRTTERWIERWLPASWRGARWDPGRAGAVALAGVAAVAAVVAAIGVWSGRPVTETVPPLPSVSGPGPVAASTGASPSPAGGPIVVSVSGKVARPGLVRLPEGSRVGEAVAAAGGASQGVDLSGLNLAARLADGEQVAVGVPPPAAADAPTAPGAPANPRARGSVAATPGDKVDLNTATLEQLDGLPGVGPVTAQKILDWRTQNGRFTSVDQLQEVGGIGPARLNTLRARVTV